METGNSGVWTLSNILAAMTVFCNLLPAAARVMVKVLEIIVRFNSTAIGYRRKAVGSEISLEQAVILLIISFRSQKLPLLF